MPREVPLTKSITPLRAKAWRCSSAALADLKPKVRAISARVGGGTGFGYAVLDQFQNLLLPGRQLGMVCLSHDHLMFLFGVNRVQGWGENTVFLSSTCIFNQFLRLCKWFLHIQCKKL